MFKILANTKETLNGTKDYKAKSKLLVMLIQYRCHLSFCKPITQLSVTGQNCNALFWPR